MSEYCNKVNPLQIISDGCAYFAMSSLYAARFDARECSSKFGSNALFATSVSRWSKFG